jgi:hypothetical protein
VWHLIVQTQQRAQMCSDLPIPDPSATVLSSCSIAVNAASASLSLSCASLASFLLTDRSVLVNGSGGGVLAILTIFSFSLQTKRTTTTFIHYVQLIPFIQILELLFINPLRWRARHVTRQPVLTRFALLTRDQFPKLIASGGRVKSFALSSLPLLRSSPLRCASVSSSQASSPARPILNKMECAIIPNHSFFGSYC